LEEFTSRQISLFRLSWRIYSDNWGFAAEPSPVDTQWFIGIGGGFDLTCPARRLALATDYVNTHLFSNLLVPGKTIGGFPRTNVSLGHLK